MAGRGVFVGELYMRIWGSSYSVYTAEMDQHKQQAALKFEEQLRHI
jgi:hypothetical protein